jgi:hypothetical protein
VITITNPIIIGWLPHGHFCCGTCSFDTGAASFPSVPKRLTIIILWPTYPVFLPKKHASITHCNITSASSLKSNSAAKKNPPNTCFCLFFGTACDNVGERGNLSLCRLLVKTEIGH